MKIRIDPDLEAFFVALAMQLGTHPKPLFGIERAMLANTLVPFIRDHPGKPEIIAKVRRNYAELGGKLLDTDPNWFYTKLADAYLDWLYAQPESQALYDPKDFKPDVKGLADLSPIARRRYWK